MNNEKCIKVTKPMRHYAEIWDQMQYFFKEYNDHQVRGVIYFDGLLDRELIKRAIILSLDIVPILKSCFVIDRSHPYWEEMDSFKESEIISFGTCLSLEDKVQSFITDTTDEMNGPQIRAKMIRVSNRDTLCILINHMVCDGDGFKEYLYLIGDIYTGLQNGTYDALNYKTVSRNSKMVYKKFDFIDRLKIFLLPNEPTKSKNRIFFPLSNRPERPFIMTHTLTCERFEMIKRYSKTNSVTINDIILAAYYRALFKILNLSDNEQLTIPCMMDLRRYLEKREPYGIFNLSSMIICNLSCVKGESFEDTVKRVNAEMSKKKNGFPGLHGLSTLNLLFNFLPFSVVKKIIKKNYVNPAIGITNIGIIDSKRLSFGEIPVMDSFITGSIKYPPYFQVALTTYNNSITFSVNLYGSEIDKKSTKELFALLDKELLINKY